MVVTDHSLLARPTAAFLRQEGAPSPTSYGHETMSRKAFRSYVAKVYGWRGVRGTVFRAPYQQVEYLNAPAGLVVLAHHDDYAGQVDGLHPASLSHHVEGWASIVQPFGRPGGGYAMHFLPRKWQGKLVIGAFGKMIQAGSPQAPSFQTEEDYFTLEAFDGPDGPIVAVIKDAGTVHVIRPVTGVATEREAA